MFAPEYTNTMPFTTAGEESMAWLLTFFDHARLRESTLAAEIPSSSRL